MLSQFLELLNFGESSVKLILWSTCEVQKNLPWQSLCGFRHLKPLSSMAMYVQCWGPRVCLKPDPTFLDMVPLWIIPTVIHMWIHCDPYRIETIAPRQNTLATYRFLWQMAIVLEAISKSPCHREVCGESQKIVLVQMSCFRTCHWSTQELGKGSVMRRHI